MPLVDAGVVVASAGWLLTYLLHSTLLLAAAWLLSRTGWVRRPTGRELLWKVAALAGVVTATAALGGDAWGRPGRPGAVLRTLEESRVARFQERFELPRGGPAGGIEEPESTGAPSEAVAMRRRVRAVLARPSPECGVALRGADPADPAWTARARAACVDGVGSPAPLLPGLLILWGVGALALGVGELGRHRRLARLRRSLRPAGPGVDALLSAVAAEAGCFAVRAGVSERVSVPCVVGHGLIALPTRCESDLAEDELRAALAHEVAHVVRRDLTWTAGLRTLQALLWLQPLNRLAGLELQECAEHACDDWAASRTGGAGGLARSLLRVSEWVVDSASPIPGPAMLRRTGAVRERVARILRGSRRAERGSRLGTGLLVAALSLPVGGLPRVPAHAPDAVVLTIEEWRQGDAVAGVEPARRIVRWAASGADAPDEVEVLRVTVRAREEGGIPAAPHE